MEKESIKQKNIIFNNDRPILTMKDDNLGRVYYAKYLAKSILNIQDSQPFVIGLYGKWGSGKTSIINMIVEEIEKEIREEKTKKKYRDEETPIIINFEPWNFSSSEEIITQFFRHLSVSIKDYYGPDIMKNTSALLNAISVMSGIVQYLPVPVLSGATSFINKSAVSLSKDIKEKLKNKDLLTIKNEIVENLRSKKSRIIVVIDDIDRLTNEQIKTVFQLVSAVANFPNITYILSMDKDIVVEALKEAQKGSGDDFLEKIVQFPITVPMIDKSKVEKILINKLNEILDTENINVDNQYFLKLFNFLSNFILDLRDVKRVMNLFMFKYYALKEEVNIIDLFVLCVIEIKLPCVYELIKVNKFLFVYGKESLYESENKDKEYYLTLLNKMEDKYKENSKNIFRLLSELFPIVNGLHQNSTYLKEKRICHADMFDLYFQLDLSEIGVSDNILKSSIYDYDLKGLNDLITEFNKKGNIIEYLQKLKVNIDNIPLDRRYIFIKVLFENYHNLKGEKEGPLLSISADTYCYYCLHEILRISNEKNNLEFFKNEIELCDIYLLNTIAYFINIIRIHYGLNPDTENRINQDYQYISLEGLKEIEKKFLLRLKEVLNNENIFDLDNLNILVYVWRLLDIESYNSFMYSLLVNNSNKLKFVLRFSSLWNGTSGIGYSFYEDKYKDFISNDEVLNILNNYNKKELFQDFNYDELIKLASFVLNNQKERFDDTNIDEAKDLILKWKNESDIKNNS